MYYRTMKSSAEFINIANKAFVSIDTIEKYTSFPISFQSIFEVFKVTELDDSKFVICFDKLPSITVLLQLLSFLKKEKKTYVYLSSDFIAKESSYFSIIYRYKIPFVDCFAHKHDGIDQKINFFDEMIQEVNADTEYTYTRNTQLVFKYYLFNKRGSYTTRAIADFIKISPSSVSRANETLYSLGVLKKTGYGAGIEYKLANRKTAIKVLQNYFILPYEKTYTLLVEDYDFQNLSKNPVSGDYALSEYTDLLPLHNNKIYAVWKKKFMTFYNAYTSLTHLNPRNYIMVQSFIYDPTIFSKNEFIDLLDMYIIVLKKENLNDPRINEAFKILERIIINYE